MIGKEITGTSVVKIFNTIGAEHYQAPVFQGQNATMFYCGDDPEAKKVAAQIAADINFAAIDAGDSSMGQHLVNLAMFWITLMRNGMGRDNSSRSNSFQKQYSNSKSNLLALDNTDAR